MPIKTKIAGVLVLLSGCGVASAEEILCSASHGQCSFIAEGGYISECPKSHTWTGACVDGLASGKGVLTLSPAEDKDEEPRRFEGEMRSGRLVEGALHDASTDCPFPAYEGGFLKGMPHGRGRKVVYCWDEGGTIIISREYRGEYSKGKKHGWGMGKRWLVADDLYGTYEGFFANNFEEGVGTYTEGRVLFTGEWKRGKKHGRGVAKLTSGEFTGARLEGEWVDDKLHGDVRIFYTNGRVLQGLATRGELDNVREISSKSPSDLGRLLTFFYIGPVRIEAGTYISTRNDANARPTYSMSDKIYGQADIKFAPAQ